eukprot:Nitzschia sp. Nitz4//scaffold272_size25479//3836//8863//NITZ4_008307-RA/size25479-processed-gene-0.9-mRNA-1//-1//CDS//3329545219//2398//frame0
MINIRPVWEEKGYLGSGIRVRINDAGVEASHPEFSGRFDVASSCDVYEPPANILDSDIASHGTAVASILGGAHNNDKCAAGIAPEVTLSSCFALSSDRSVLDTSLDSFDISQNSYGNSGCEPVSSDRNLAGETCPFTYSDVTTYPCNVCNFNNIDETCELYITYHCYYYYEHEVEGCTEFLDLLLGGNCMYNSLSEENRVALVNGVVNGRDGRGIIYVVASGNSYTTGDDTNFQGFTNTRLVITVGAVGKDLKHASYSTPGASLFVTAPGGDFENMSNQAAATIGGSCGSPGFGTSFSCPVVSGVIALMLEANPELSWRDVQHILALTSKSVLDNDDTTAYENAAGYWHSNQYGFGIVDALEAVEKAETWESVGTEQQLITQSGLINLALPDDEESPVMTSLVIDASSSFVSESVVVQLDLEHFSRGDLKIVLTSPQGTSSLLSPGERPENTQLGDEERWKLMTVRAWGENPNGEWTLSIVDISEGATEECVDDADWEISSGSLTVDCASLELNSVCVDGELDPQGLLTPIEYYSIFNFVSEGGLKAAEACCACGGGVGADNVVDQLKQWTLVVYGNGPSVPTKLPTPSPTWPPTKSPTLAPSTRVPTLPPTNLPTMNPTLLPSLVDQRSTPMPSAHTSETQTGGPTSNQLATPVVTSAPESLPAESDNSTSAAIGCNDYTQATCSPSGNTFSDPLYSGQSWVYDMINVQSVWEDKGYYGNGVRVRVNDNGVESTHPEFEGRFDVESSCEIYEPPEDVLASTTASHGTSVAAILGGARNNGKCSVGIAPDVTLSSCYAFTVGDQILDYNLDAFDISQNSYGNDGCEVVSRRLASATCPFTYSAASTYPCDVCDFDDVDSTCEAYIVAHCANYYENDVAACIEFLDIVLGGNCEYNVLSDANREALVNGVTNGRDGKGIVYLFAAGNAFGTGDNTNFQGFTNTRFVITVGAVGKDSMHASYSTTGASVFVAAPGGDFENISNHIVATVDGTCGDAGSGTSFACPVVSGVIALMLEANPELSWRDVQHILALTSKSVLDNDDTTAYENAAGYWHSNQYGFGIVDALEAVEKAETWESVGTEQQLITQSGLINLALPDDEESPVMTSLVIDASSSFVSESVVVQLDLEHFSRGDLKIVLTSPQGTSSLLSPGERPENTQLGDEERWKLMTVRAWGENPNGEWTLSIVDISEEDVEECADAFWEVPAGSGTTVDCAYLEKNALCVDGELDPTGLLSENNYYVIFNYVSNGLKSTEACCACGGGLGSDEVVDQLIQWTLIVYGSASPTTTTTSAPTSNGTKTPGVATVSPTSTNTTSTASVAPSLSPSLISSIPTNIPTGAPTHQPTKEPTPVPTATPSSAAFVPSKLLCLLAALPLWTTT